MAQRLLKIVIPEDGAEKALRLLDDLGKPDYWQEGSKDGCLVYSVLLDSGDSEAFMDQFETSFDGAETFHMILLPVEAIVPRPVEEDKEAEKDGSATPAEEKKTPLHISREELYADIVDSTRLTRIYLIMAVLSTVVASVGLLRDNVAVIIGAMVIAPFLGPNVALALSINLADYKLGLNALKTMASGILAALLMTGVMGLLVNVDPTTPEIAARTQAGLSDVALALAAGCAGVLAFTTGAPSAVIGVMVAVALLPPLAVAGLLAGAGFWPQAGAAFLLFLTNIISINLAGIITFLFQGISPRSWWEAERARKATRRALGLWTVVLGILVIILAFWESWI
ncbi:MAG: TIGR00341 family protein [Acidobacteria bacterium]|nr:TIGR00341 family protein [Acidobacteriota bacterium]